MLTSYPAAYLISEITQPFCLNFGSAVKAIGKLIWSVSVNVTHGTHGILLIFQ
jgi:hypothetical protein